MAGKQRGDTRPYYEQISDRLIQQLEEGTAPFQKPWVPGELQMPHNPTTGAAYRGSNAFWLAMQGREDPRWMTYKQAQSVGAQVMKGEKGTRIEYWKFHDTIPKKDTTGKPLIGADGRKVVTSIQLDRPRMFSATVFNAEQIQGLPKRESLAAEPWQRHERAEAVLKASAATIQHDQSDRAFYRPSTDSIHLPGRASFPDADRYYSTALHELGHWTGHPRRLDRDLTGSFGSESYAKEELRAEISSLMVGSELGVGHEIGQHAAYVKSWIKALRDDPKEILRASRDADKIKDKVLSYDRGREVETTMDATVELADDASADVIQKAEKYAERFSNDEDRQKFMEGVRGRLVAGVERASSVVSSTLKAEEPQKASQGHQQDVELER